MECTIEPKPRSGCPPLEQLRPRLHTGGLIIADDPAFPGGFLLVNRQLGRSVRLPAEYVPDMLAFMERHRKENRKPGISLPCRRCATGRMKQQCPKCGWKNGNSIADFGACPFCGKSLADADCSLQFNRLTIFTWRKGFIASDKASSDPDEGVRLWNADVEEIIECLADASGVPAPTVTPATREAPPAAAPTIRCIRCGRIFSHDARFCPRCGRDTREPSDDHARADVGVQPLECREASKPASASAMPPKSRQVWQSFVIAARWIAFVPAGLLSGVAVGILVRLSWEPSSLVGMCMSDIAAICVAVSAGVHVAPTTRKTIPAIAIGAVLFVLLGACIVLSLQIWQWSWLVRYAIGIIAAAVAVFHQIERPSR